MKKYSKPRTSILNTNFQLMAAISAYTGGDCDNHSPIGTDNETISGSGAPTMGMDSKRFWNL